MSFVIMLIAHDRQARVLAPPSALRSVDPALARRLPRAGSDRSLSTLQFKAPIELEADVVVAL